MLPNELRIDFNQPIKRVEFFPYEWNSNLIALILNDGIRFYNLLFRSDSDEFEELEVHQDDIVDVKSSKNLILKQICSINNQRMDHFCFNPKTNLIRSEISFLACDNSKNLLFYDILLSNQMGMSSNKTFETIVKKEKMDCNCVYKVKYDNHKGELVGITADFFFFIWDVSETKPKARYELQSSGIDIEWNLEEEKVVVAEKAGLVRIYNTSTLRPIYTLTLLGVENSSICLSSMDWCQQSPEIIIASGDREIYVWNTSLSCLPTKLLDSKSKIKQVRMLKHNENLIGYWEGHDSSSNIQIYNYKTNQIIYKSPDFKLLKSFSMNATSPIMAVASEQSLIISSLFLEANKRI